VYDAYLFYCIELLIISMSQMMFNYHNEYTNSVQCRSAIWFQDETQKEAAASKIEKLSQEKGRNMSIDLAPLGEFYMAEDHNQKYQESNGRDIFELLF